MSTPCALSCPNNPVGNKLLAQTAEVTPPIGAAPASSQPFFFTRFLGEVLLDDTLLFRDGLFLDDRLLFLRDRDWLLALRDRPLLLPDRLLFFDLLDELRLSRLLRERSRLRFGFDLCLLPLCDLFRFGSFFFSLVERDLDREVFLPASIFVLSLSSLEPLREAAIEMS